MHVLIVDDEEMIREVIKEYLDSEEFSYMEATSGKEALEMLLNYSYDMMILDIMMPEMDGFSLLKKLPKKFHVPTIVLSAREDEYDKLQGFDLGIDDYLTKPFSPKELIARMKAIKSRTQKHSISIYRYQALEVNFSAHQVKINHQEVNMTPKEFEILSYLIKNKNIAISREQLLSKLWGYDYFGDDRTIDTHIKTLRNSLGIYRKLIQTVHSVGYKFCDDE